MVCIPSFFSLPTTVFCSTSCCSTEFCLIDVWGYICIKEIMEFIKEKTRREEFYSYFWGIRSNSSGPNGILPAGSILYLFLFFYKINRLCMYLDGNALAPLQRLMNQVQISLIIQ